MNNAPVKIAVWDTPFTALAMTALRESSRTQVVSGSVVDMEVALRAGRVDMALLPTDRVLMAGDDFDVLPAVGISTWSNPYTKLVLEEGLPDAENVEPQEVHLRCEPDGALAGLVAKIILREHYGLIAKVTLPLDSDILDGGLGLLASLAGAEARTEEAGSLKRNPGIELDLGQEWYELVNYPMVWAVFAMRKGEVEDGHIRLVRDLLVALDEDRRARVLASGALEGQQEFELNELRLRMDDLAIASLTELGEYMYFYELKESIDPVAFASLSEDA